jgi:hypothetical protein
MITFNAEPIIRPPEGNNFRETYSYEFTTFNDAFVETTVRVGGTNEGGANYQAPVRNNSYKVKQTQNGGSAYSNLDIDYGDQNESYYVMSSYESYIGFYDVGGISTSWPFHPNNFSLQRTNNIIETGFDYFKSKAIIKDKYTYKEYLLDILDTIGNNFNYRTYIDTVNVPYVGQFSQQLNTDIPIEVPAIDYNIGYQTSEPQEVIYTIGFGQPGRVYHISEFNGIRGTNSFVFPSQAAYETKTEFEYVYEGAGASYTEYGYSVDVLPYNLIPITPLYGQANGETILRPPNNLLAGTFFVNNGQFFETYSIQINRTFKTSNILSPNLENQLVHYNYEDQYRSVYANSELQEFQNRTLGFTYRSTTSFGGLGSFFCYLASTIDKNDQIRFLRPVKFDKNLTETVVGNFSMYDREVQFTFSPGIYNITRLPTNYTNNNQSSFQQLYVNPSQGNLDIVFPKSQLFSIEPDNMAFYGGYDFGDEGVNEGVDGGDMESATLFEDGSFITANMPLESTAYPIFSTLNKYIEDAYEPDFDIDKYDSFYNSTKWFAQESTALHKLTEEGYIDGIWRCYTQEPYSSIYNTEF